MHSLVWNWWIWKKENPRTYYNLIFPYPYRISAACSQEGAAPNDACIPTSRSCQPRTILLEETLAHSLITPTFQGLAFVYFLLSKVYRFHSSSFSTWAESVVPAPDSFCALAVLINSIYIIYFGCLFPIWEIDANLNEESISSHFKGWSNRVDCWGSVLEMSPLQGPLDPLSQKRRGRERGREGSRRRKGGREGGEKEEEREGGIEVGWGEKKVQKEKKRKSSQACFLALWLRWQMPSTSSLWLHIYMDNICMLRPDPCFCLYQFPGTAGRYCQLLCAQVFSCQCIFQTADRKWLQIRTQDARALPTWSLCNPEWDSVSPMLSITAAGLEDPAFLNWTKSCAFGVMGWGVEHPFVWTQWPPIP